MIEDALHKKRARFRILMRTPYILWSTFSGRPGSRRFSSAVGPDLCTILHPNFREFLFHALG
jgi:hypothetical protein